MENMQHSHEVQVLHVSELQKFVPHSVTIRLLISVVVVHRLFTQVIAAFVTNVLWYAILSPELAKMVESFLWRGSFVVISSLTIFIRLFFNSKQVF